MKKTTTALAALALLAVSAPAYAQDYVITIKDRVFSPKEITIPKDTKVKVTVKNMDSVPAEFESHEMKREKVIAAGSQATLNIGPLAPGRYPFFDEFNEKNTGTVIVE